MQVFELSEELTKRAVGVLAKKDALNEAMRVFMEQVAANHIEVMEFWRDVDREAKGKGIEKAKDETYTFDFNERKCMITKVKQG